MNVGHSTTFDGLSRAAGREAGLRSPTPEAVAKDAAARDLRDALWAEYERVLADDRTYTIEAVRAWLAERGVQASIATVHRNRAREAARWRARELASETARRFLEATGGRSADEVFEAARKRAAQVLFDLFMRLPADALEDLDPAQILRAFEVAGKLGKAHAETEMVAARLAEMQRNFDAQVRKAAGTSGDGRLTREQIAEIREAVFGSAA